jgi:hypothetical protein
MWWCCRKATGGAETEMLDVVVLQESYIWCKDRNARCHGVDGNLKWFRDRNAICFGIAGKLHLMQGQKC